MGSWAVLAPNMSDSCTDLNGLTKGDPWRRFFEVQINNGFHWH
jgi:hypothetical protein